MNTTDKENIKKFLVSLIGKKEIKVCVHDGIFHADDVLCVALLTYFYDKSEIVVIRTRNYNISDFDFILDIGREERLVNNTTLILDHHQEGNRSYPNGVEMAACGKLAEYLLPLWENGDLILIKLREKLLYSVEAQDNGQSIPGLGANKLAWVGDTNPTIESDSNGNKEFDICTSMATYILSAIIEGISVDIKNREILHSIIRNNTQRFLVLNKFYHWQEEVIMYNNLYKNDPNKQIIFVIYPTKTGNWNCQVVPKELGNYEAIKNLPKSWGTKTGKDLEKVSGIPGAIFCHAGLFVSGWQTKEAAIAAANISLIN